MQALALSDDDGDGIWSGTVSLPEGAGSSSSSNPDGGDWGPRRTSTVSSALTLPTTTTAFGAVDGNTTFPRALVSALQTALAQLLQRPTT